MNQINGPPPIYVASSSNSYVVNMTRFEQQVLPAPMPKTMVWGYGGLVKDAVTGAFLGFVRNSPGPTFEVTNGSSIEVTWENEITGSSMFAVDPTIHWANPNNMTTPTPSFKMFPPGYLLAQSPVPLVTHVHGLEVQSTSDGGPDEWFTTTGIHGPDYFTSRPTLPNAAVYEYPNEQPPATLWYHDHALGVTRINVMSGLAGFYLIRDSRDPLTGKLPSGKYEVPLAIQDRSFFKNGSFYFPDNGDNQSAHPYWLPEFFGNTIMVNGKVWPNMNVDRGQYRFRLLDGSNARFYTLTFSNGMSFTQIGTDGGYLKSPVSMRQITLAPGERADILVDFSNVTPGTRVRILNSAVAPSPGGDPPDPDTTGQIMQFSVTNTTGFKPEVLPASLNPTLLGTFPNLPVPDKTRILTLYEIEGSDENPLMVTLDGQMWDNPISELPKQGTTEDWDIVDTTMDNHPIHLHLVQFQLVSRQPFDIVNYTSDWIKLNGQPPLMHPTISLDPSQYITGPKSGPQPNEMGWKDTIQMRTGEITIIRARWARQDGLQYGFDPTLGPGYVWHCHILDHEDNEMMRPYKVIS
ncbi:MAG TPA: multicopper oxidase [Methanoregulaceae archaeon]|nr:multicopper oxidase [Methanoregulaceae archaeon]